MVTRQTEPLAGKTALITGAAQRIGAGIARTLHQLGANIALHYHQSHDHARRLASELEDQRADSVELIQADVLNTADINTIVTTAQKRWRRLDVLVNNASAFYPTPVGEIDEKAWDELSGSNLKAPLFLSQAAAPYLRETQGCIVNIADIHALHPIPNHTVYCAAKAGLIAATKALAIELAPDIRVNAVAPGAILPPPEKESIPRAMIDSIPLQRPGDTADIADTVAFLSRPGGYITGQVIVVDGGKSL